MNATRMIGEGGGRELLSALAVNGQQRQTSRIDYPLLGTFCLHFELAGHVNGIK
jgi:hypothetical protein